MLKIIFGSTIGDFISAVFYLMSFAFMLVTATMAFPKSPVIFLIWLFVAVCMVLSISIKILCFLEKTREKREGINE